MELAFVFVISKNSDKTRENQAEEENKMDEKRTK